MRELEEYSSFIQNSEKVMQTSVILTKVLWDSILKNGFEGKLIPQDPSDELAEVLLEKIKSEKSNLHRNNNSKKTRSSSSNE